MAEFWVTFKGDRQHKVEAPDRDAALERWADEQGYDSLEHAAREYLGSEKDFKAQRVGF